MKICKQIEDVQTNITSSKEFTFKDSQKIFSILSDNLYSNKIGSIIRELSCNAYDSHIQMGLKNIPFEIQLPSIFSPIFFIRDYGTGISKENMFKIFSCYGESTKTDSNDFVGAFGLGSKTPLSYTKSFSVTSYYDGYKTIYSVFLNESGIPCLSEISSSPTKETGFKVSFGVKNEDFSAFKFEVLHQLCYFPYLVKVDGELLSENKEVKQIHNKLESNILIQSGPLSIYKDYDFRFKINELDDCSTFSININGIVYNHLQKESDIIASFVHRLKDKQDVRIVYNCNIGDLDLTASRENVSFTKKTEEKVKSILEEIEAKIDKRFDELTGLKKIRFGIIDFPYLEPKLELPFYIEPSKFISIGFKIVQFYECRNEFSQKIKNNLNFNTLAFFKTVSKIFINDQCSSTLNSDLTKNAKLFSPFLEKGEGSKQFCILYKKSDSTKKQFLEDVNSFLSQFKIDDAIKFSDLGYNPAEKKKTVKNQERFSFLRFITNFEVENIKNVTVSDLLETYKNQKLLIVPKRKDNSAMYPFQRGYFPKKIYCREFSKIIHENISDDIICLFIEYNELQKFKKKYNLLGIKEPTVYFYSEFNDSNLIRRIIDKKLFFESYKKFLCYDILRIFPAFHGQSCMTKRIKNIENEELKEFLSYFCSFDDFSFMLDFERILEIVGDEQLIKDILVHKNHIEYLAEKFKLLKLLSPYKETERELLEEFLNKLYKE